jgi:NAD dependent epimerase/dehydratase family enzyme
MFGQMAEEALLASACVHPDKLMAAGFRFSMPVIEEALRAAME